MILLVLGSAAYRGAVQFTDEYDFWWYHLPAVLRFMGNDLYQPEPYIAAMIDGYPPLAHMAQALLAMLSGRLQSTGLVNAFGLCAALVWAKRLLGERLPLRWTLTAMLAIPAVAIQLGRGYIDLWCGAWLLLAALSVLALYQQTARVPAAAWAFAAGVGCASLSKFTTMPHIAALFPFFVHALWWRGASLRRIIGGVAIAGLLAGAWPARNVLVHRNPTYPYPTAVSEALGATPDARYAAKMALAFDAPVNLKEMAPPLRFVYSAFELSRLVPNDEPYKWSLHQTARGMNQSPHFRLGGWFFFTMLVFVALVAAGVWRGTIPGAAGVMVLAMAGIVMPLQMSYELRYWLALPLTLAVLGAQSLRELPRPWRRVGQGALIFAMIFVNDRVKTVRGITATSVANVAPPEALAFWRDQSGTATADDGAYVIACRQPQTLFWTGPAFRQFRVTERAEPCPAP